MSGALFLAAVLAVTAGWENVNPNRREFEPAKVLWRADFSRGADFTLDRIGGAEGSVEFRDGTAVLRKTNREGRAGVLI